MLACDRWIYSCLDPPNIAVVPQTLELQYAINGLAIASPFGVVTQVRFFFVLWRKIISVLILTFFSAKQKAVAEFGNDNSYLPSDLTTFSQGMNVSGFFEMRFLQKSKVFCDRLILKGLFLITALSIRRRQTPSQHLTFRFVFPFSSCFLHLFCLHISLLSHHSCFHISVCQSALFSHLFTSKG